MTISVTLGQSFNKGAKELRTNTSCQQLVKRFVATGYIFVTACVFLRVCRISQCLVWVSLELGDQNVCTLNPFDLYVCVIQDKYLKR